MLARSFWGDLRGEIRALPPPKIKQGEGRKFGFTGVTQNGYGPEWWGITLEQLRGVTYNTANCATISEIDAQGCIRTASDHGFRVGPWFSDHLGAKVRLHGCLESWESGEFQTGQDFEVEVLDARTVKLIIGCAGQVTECDFMKHLFITELLSPSMLCQTRIDPDSVFTMRNLVDVCVAPATKGFGIGYALAINATEPLRARTMVSHAWDESYKEFLKALGDSDIEGPFWVCAMSIYQPEDMPDVSIAKQLGPQPASGPFATVLKQAACMVAIITNACDIYTRMWCVYEMSTALELGVPVKLSEFHQNRDQKFSGTSAVLDHQIRALCERPVKCKEARCGNPADPPNADEMAIRRVIENSPGGYRAVDNAIEKLRLVCLIENQKTMLDSLLKAAMHPGPRRPAPFIGGRPFYGNYMRYNEDSARNNDLMSARQNVINEVKGRLPRDAFMALAPELLAAHKACEEKAYFVPQIPVPSNREFPSPSTETTTCSCVIGARLAFARLVDEVRARSPVVV